MTQNSVTINDPEDHVLYGDLKTGDMFVWMDVEPSDMRILMKLEAGDVELRKGIYFPHILSQEYRPNLKCKMIKSVTIESS